MAKDKAIVSVNEIKALLKEDGDFLRPLVQSLIREVGRGRTGTWALCVPLCFVCFRDTALYVAAAGIAGVSENGKGSGHTTLWGHGLFVSTLWGHGLFVWPAPGITG